MIFKHITVSNKIANYVQRDGAIVCGNSDYTIAFAFDSEWNEHEKKMARFIWNGAYYDREFEGNECPVPIITNADEIRVGVYAGNLQTTTSAVIPCLKSILCDKPLPQPEAVKDYCDLAHEYADEANEAAERAENVVSEIESILSDLEAELEMINEGGIV